MSWDEAFSARYNEWSAEMTAAGEPIADYSGEYVFVTRRRGG